MFDVEAVKELFKTKPGTAYFWSGLGMNGAEIAAQVEKENGGTTLEMLMDHNKGALIDAGFPYDSEYDRFIWDNNSPEITQAWSDISECYASQTSGNVRVVLGNEIRDAVSGVKMKFCYCLSM